MPHADPEDARQYRKRKYLKQKLAGTINREAARKAVKKWRAANREHSNEIQRRSWHKNKERLNAERREKLTAEDHKNLEAARKQRMEADPELKERRLESHRRSYARRREHCIEKTKAYAKANPEKVKQYSRTTSFNRRTAKGTHTTEQWEQRFAFYGGRCAYCSVGLTLSTSHRDHVIPLNKGGTNWASNLVPACADCNLRKHVKRWMPYWLDQKRRSLQA